MEKNYIPINCDFYDELELWALRKTECTILYRTDQGEQQVNGIIANLYAKNKEEFMELTSGQLIRLDQLIRVNDKIVPNAC